MAVVKELKRGEPCPACFGELKAAHVPTDEQYRRSFDKENPIALPPGADTANPEQRAELGELFRCTTCRYQTRFKPEAAAPAKAKRKAVEPGNGEE
jgi:hypothetical protein